MGNSDSRSCDCNREFNDFWGKKSQSNQSTEDSVEISSNVEIEDNSGDSLDLSFNSDIDVETEKTREITEAREIREQREKVREKYLYDD